MPSTMQQSIVKNSAMNTEPRESVTIAVMICEARPVIVMQPPIMPATPQAAATVIELFAPLASASKNTAGDMTASFRNMHSTVHAIATSSSARRIGPVKPRKR